MSSSQIIDSDAGNTDVSPFVVNLFNAINHDRFKDIITWSDNGGQYFVIYSMERFKNEVLPEYFKTTSYSTFVR